jgi:serine/threonine protein kinase
MFIGGKIPIEALHFYIMQAKTDGMYFYVPEKRFITPLEIPPDAYVDEELRLAGERREVTEMATEYVRLRNNLMTARVLFRDNVSALDVLGKWMPIQVLGSGHQGSVYRVCDEFSCDYALKLTEPNENEIEIYKLASNLDVAPLFHDAGLCNVGGQVMQYIVSERMDEDLFSYIRTHKNRAHVFQRVMEILILLAENGIRHGDSKVCNFLIRDDTVVKLADYGLSKMVPGQDVVASFLGHMRLFLSSLLHPDEYSCGDYYETSIDEYEREIREAYRNLKWKLKGGLLLAYFNAPLDE